MNALELADYVDEHHGMPATAAMLRKQDAAIRQLREALEYILVRYDNGKQGFDDARAALAATEEFT